MLKFNSRYDAYAYRIGWFELKNGVTLEEGQWVKLDENNKVVIAGEGDKGFLAIGSSRKGRDQVAGKAVNQVAFLHGAFSVWTDKVKGTVEPMSPLKIGENGVLEKATLPGDAGKVVAWALQQKEGFTQIVSA